MAQAVNMHVTRVTPVESGPDEEHRFECACGYQSKVYPTRNAAVVGGWLHTRKMAKDDPG